MTKRTFVLLTIFLIFVIFGGLFIATYKLYWNQQIRNYVFELATCGLLAEAACQDNPRCEPIYKPITSAKVTEFERCKLIPDYKKQNLAQAKTLCDQTGGKWEKIKYGFYCNCLVAGKDKVYAKDKGCQIK